MISRAHHGTKTRSPTVVSSAEPRSSSQPCSPSQGTSRFDAASTARGRDTPKRSKRPGAVLLGHAVVDATEVWLDPTDNRAHNRVVSTPSPCNYPPLVSHLLYNVS